MGIDEIKPENAEADTCLKTENKNKTEVIYLQSKLEIGKGNGQRMNSFI